MWINHTPVEACMSKVILAAQIRVDMILKKELKKENTFHQNKLYQTLK